MIKVRISRKAKPSFNVYFKTFQDARTFAEFVLELIENVKKKTLEKAKS
jgi:ATP-dependent Clp protease adapter protein ClpS